MIPKTDEEHETKHDEALKIDIINQTNFYMKIGEMFNQVKETRAQVIILNKAINGNGEKGLLQKHEVLFTRFCGLDEEHKKCQKDKLLMAETLLLLQQDLKKRREQEARYRWNKKQWAAVLGLLFTGIGIFIQLFEYREIILKIISMGKH
jgi:hypothetical protein